jgi:tetratricopeptide (TPR) repeat protein
MDPANADGWLAIGICLDSLNRLTEGIHYIKKAIEINPNEAEYWYVFAEVQQKLGFQEEAALAYQRVIELEYPDYDVWLDYSKLMHESGYFTEALEVIQEGIKNFPDVPALYYRLGVLLLESGNKQDAMSVFSNALQLDYNEHGTIFEYAPSLENNGELLQLINQYKK